METLYYKGAEVLAREISRPAKCWQCRALESAQGDIYLEYLVSVGPYKVDVSVVRRLSASERASYLAGTLDLGALANTMAERDTKTGTHERKRWRWPWQ